MNPPSDVTVLSESEPIPSLLPLLLDALLANSSLPAPRGTRNAASLRSEAAAAAGATAVDIDGLRGARLSAATTFDTDTDVVAGVSTGRRMLGERCVGLSISRDLRLGDELDDCVPSTRRSGAPEAVLRRATASTKDELGTDDETAAELGVLDPFELGEVDAIGLLPLFGDGVASGLMVGFDGADTLRAGVDGLDMDFGEVGTVEGALVGGRLSEASRRSISGGIGVPWTMFTAFHSAAWIMLYSNGEGGRQHPGHPGLLYPFVFAGGSMSTHWGTIKDGLRG